MEEQLISFETAKLAKEKGFNISGINIYENENLLCDVEFKNWNNGTLCLLAPTQSLLQKWLREKHQLFITVNAKGVIDEIVWYNNVTIRTKKDHKFENYYRTYEEALEVGLLEALKLITNK